MKRLSTCILVVLMLLLVLAPCTASAASKKVTKNGFVYSISGDTATLTKYEGTAKVVKIPGKIKGATVTAIGGNAFRNNKKIEKVTIPASVKTIKNGGAFSGCKNLKEVVIPTKSKLKTIGDKSFYKCKSLSKITLPKSLRYLKYSCFSYCSSLEKLNLPEGLKSVEQEALSCAKIKTLHIPSTLEYFDIWTSLPNLERFTVAKGSDDYRVHDGVLYHRLDKWCLWFYPEAKTGESYKVPSFAKKVYSDTFKNTLKYLKLIDIGTCKVIGTLTIDDVNRIRCEVKVSSQNKYYKNADHMVLSKDGKTLMQIPSTLTGTVTVPKSVKTIKEYSGEFSKATEIILPNGLKKIEGAAFWQSDTLETIHIPSTVKKLEGDTFSSCTNLKNVALPEGMETIGASDFAWCENLSAVYIPKSIKTIKSGAFIGAFFENVYYGGTKAQWNKIKKSGNAELNYARKIYSYDTSVMKTSFESVTATENGIHAIWMIGKKFKTAGYELQLAKDENFAQDPKTFLMEGLGETELDITGLEPATTYFLKVRTYKVANGKKVYSGWSQVQSVTTSEALTE